VKRFVVPIVALFTLAVPASASAHARTSTVALDYRLVLDDAARRLPGIGLEILDGDRTLRVRVEGVTLVVHGDLGEQMLRIGPGGAWANRASPTAVAENLTTPGRGWTRIGGDGGFVWHDHRLAPPPYDGTRLGDVARFTIPATVAGEQVPIAGWFVRVGRPAFWAWSVGVAVLGVAVALVVRRLRLRRLGAVVLGAAAGVAALGALVAFGGADSPSGGVAWLQIGLGCGLAAILLGVLVLLRGVAQAQFAGIVGIAAAAVSLGSLGVFRHGVVISLLGATPTRLLVAAAFGCGLAAAASGFTLEDA